jgi:hypothetical protein
MVLELAILKNFNSDTYKAGVQLAGSLTTYFDDVPVSRVIPTSALVVGNRVILAIPGDNPKDACVIATWPQGSPGGAEVHGNEYHDPAFATEAAFSNHKARHRVGGTDELELDIAQLLTGRPFWHYDGSITAGWIPAVTGSGSTMQVPLVTQVRTNATSGSTARLYLTSSAWGLSPIQYITYQYLTQFFDTADYSGWIAVVRGASYPALNEEKVGFRIENNKIYAHCANGSNNTEVDIYTLTGQPTLRLKVVSAPTAQKFYVDGVLKATITTNLPVHEAYRPMIAITNTAAADKRLSWRNVEVILG